MSGLDALLQAARYIELQAQQQQQQQQQQLKHQPPHHQQYQQSQPRLNSDVSITPSSSQGNPQNSNTTSNSTNSSNNSVYTNSSSNNTISFIPSNSTSVSETRFLPPIGKISNGTVILTAAGTAVPSNNNLTPTSGVLSAATSSSSSSPARILSPLGGVGSGAVGGSTTPGGSPTVATVVTGLVPQGTTAYLTTSGASAAQQQHPQSVTVVGSSTLSPRQRTVSSCGSNNGPTTIVPILSGSRKRTISNASSHSSSGGYVKDEPLVNGHSTAPPLVVISTNSTNNISSINSSQQKLHPIVSASASLTIDLSTKSSGPQHHQHHHLLSNSSSSSSSTSSTPPSSGCSSSSSTLTISPVDDSQSSLNLSSGSSGYITSHSANSSSSLNLSGSNSGSSPLPITINANGVASLGSNSSPLPHDLVIVQQQQQISNLLQAASQQQAHGLTSTSTLLSHVPTGGRRRTTSSTSNGVGTREVHNKLEKNRRAHLKECFEQLKKQLTLQPDEKKTSNLSILAAAIRHIQLLKRKEREYEHEMERLAKEKIASQNRILLLKREISQWGDTDFSRLTQETDAVPHSSSSISSNGSAGGVQSDRDLLNDPPCIAPGRNGIRYSSSSSLSSVATTASIGNLPLQTTISPVLVAASSPTRASPPSSVNRNSCSPATSSSSMPMPLSLTTKTTTPILAGLPDTHNGTSSPLKFTASSTTLPNGLNLSTNSNNSNGSSSNTLSVNGISNGSISGGSNCSTPNSTIGGSSATTGTSINGTSLPLIVGANNLTTMSQSQLFTPVTATILTSNNGTSIQTLPLNLNVASSASNGSSNQQSTSSIISNGLSGTASGLHIIGTAAGATIPAGLVTSSTSKELINGTALPKNGFRTDTNKIEIIATQSSAASALDPPATKVIKLVNGNTLVNLTPVDKDKMMLSQVVQQGGLVVSPIQLLTSTQGLRVIQQAPNGLATIELSTPANVQPQSSQAQRTATVGNVKSSASSFNLSHLSSQPSSHTANQSSSSHQLHQHQQQLQQVTGAQLHKLLISSTTPNGTTINGLTTSNSNGANNSALGYSTIAGSNSVVSAAGTVVSTATITPELARLPGGAELNILPAGTNGATALPLYRTKGQPGKLAFVNAIATGGGAGLTIKGHDTSSTGTGRTAVHVVTPIQTSSGQLSGLTPVVVSRFDHDTGLPGLLATTAGGSNTSTQLGKVGALVSRN